MNIGDTPEERREFWGTTSASTMSCAGFVIGIAGAFLVVKHTAFVGLAFVGIMLLALGIRSDLRKGLGVRWRRANLGFHVVFLVLTILCTAAALVVKVVEWKRLERLQHSVAPYSEPAARSPQG